MDQLHKPGVVETLPDGTRIIGNVKIKQHRLLMKIPCIIYDADDNGFGYHSICDDLGKISTDGGLAVYAGVNAINDIIVQLNGRQLCIKLNDLLCCGAAELIKSETQDE